MTFGTGDCCIMMMWHFASAETDRPARWRKHVHVFNCIVNVLKAVKGFLRGTDQLPLIRYQPVHVRTPPTWWRKRTENGQHARADDVSMGPSSIDRKIGVRYGYVRSGDCTSLLCCESRRCHGRPNEGRKADLTPLRGLSGLLLSRHAAGRRYWCPCIPP